MKTMSWQDIHSDQPDKSVTGWTKNFEVNFWRVKVRLTLRRHNYHSASDTRWVAQPTFIYDSRPRKVD